MGKTSKRITIAVSTETYGKLYAVKDYLEETFNCHVDFDACLSLLLEPKLIDYSEILPHPEASAEETIVKEGAIP